MSNKEQIDQLIETEIETTKIKLTNKEKLSLITNLGTMVSAGIPILEAVDTLVDETEGNQKKILEMLLGDLNQGESVSTSFSKSPKAFDPITINLLKSAEESGNLDSTLGDLSKNIKKDMEFLSKIRGALMYPILVFVLFIGIMVVILTYVIPRIAGVFQKLKVTLPLPTRILIRMSEIFVAYWPFIIAGTILIIILGIVLYGAKKREFINLMFSLPLLSKLARQIDLARFTKSLGLLLQSGIPITQALEFSEKAVSRKDMATTIKLARDMVASGKPLSEGLSEKEGIFPEMMLRIVAAGEKSGSLEESMIKLNVQLELEVTNTLKTITTMLEPLMLVFIGIVVGGIMLSIIAPIYQLIGSITPR